MKKYLSVFIAAILMVGCFSACNSADKSNNKSSDKLQIVTTVFPEYDWVMNVLGDKSENAEVTLLLDSGVDLHSYQPTADDILKISTCDVFIYVGGESDEWVEDALKEAKNKDMVVINLLDVLGTSAKKEEMVEGMQEEKHDHDETSHDEHDHEAGETEYDEHVWLSLRNAAVFVDEIEKALEKADADNAAAYNANAKAYTQKLIALDEEYKKTASNASVKTLLFGDRFPFRYMTDDYGLSYYAAFAGCSAETEASFETISFLAKKTDELSLNSIITIEGTDKKIAKTIVQNTKDKNQQILTLDSMQSTTAKDIQNGSTYLSIMESNLSVLKDALK